MSNFITSMAKSDKALYDKMVSLMKLFQAAEVDLKKVQVLKAAFIQKDKTLQQIPLLKFKDSARASFKSLSRSDELVESVSAVVEIEKSTDQGPEMFADSAKLSSLIEFMKCYPAVQKKEKGHGSSN